MSATVFVNLGDTLNPICPGHLYGPADDVRHPRLWAPFMDIVVWLRRAAIREHEIDETVLSSLTHETLKELGVTAVGTG